MDSVSFNLLASDEGAPPAAADASSGRAWRVLHAAAFLEGGLTFIAGTLVLYWPQSALLAALSAALYTAGSLGFLAVDVQEFFTFTSERPLRANIALSACGSLLYVVGSAGFFPAAEAVAPAVGVWGFLLGSALIFVSQCMKLARISGGGGCSGLCASRGAATAALVEGGAGLGALLFLLGTAVYAAPAGQEASGAATVLALWVGGSVAFTVGGLALAYRHFVMGVS